MQSDLNRLTEAFEYLKSNGFIIDAPLKWGFYFIDKSKKKLMALFEELEEKNYTLEAIYKADSKDKGWTLHVSKIDTLTPEKLHRRNIAFNELADYCNVEFYDGWDVERIKN